MSSPTIQKILIRNGLARVYDRWLRVEERHVESSCPGALLSQGTFLVGNLKGIGKVYLHACVDTCGSYAFGFLHTGKKPEWAV